MSLSRLGDRLLDLLVQRGDAGACVPTTGDNCSSVTTVCNGHVLYHVFRHGQVQCDGTCPWVSRVAIGTC